MGSNTCLHCGASIPQKRKFCGSSCSAKHNNTRHTRSATSRKLVSDKLRAFHKLPSLPELRVHTGVCRACGATGLTGSKKFCNVHCQGPGMRKIRAERGELRTSASLKLYLLENTPGVCVECGQGGEHNGKPLTLQMDHIDGNSDNNSLTNLRLLCPNCHTQTPTYGSKKHEGGVRARRWRNWYNRVKTISPSSIE